MLSRKIASRIGILNISTTHRSDGLSESNGPSVMQYAYGGALGGLSTANIQLLSRSILSPPKMLTAPSSTIENIQESIQTRPKTPQLKDIEDTLRHNNTLGAIKKRREAARMKYQEILLKRSASMKSTASRNSVSVADDDDSICSNGSTISTKSYISRPSSRRSVRSRPSSRQSSVYGRPSSSQSLRYGKIDKPIGVQRQVSEVDERDDKLFLFDEEFFDSANSIKEELRDRNSSSQSLHSRNTAASSGTRKKPYIKQYAEQYNTLISTINKLCSQQGDNGNKNDLAPIIKYGRLTKVTHVEIGIGVEVFCEIRPGSIKFYYNMDQDDGTVDVKSLHVRKGNFSCLPMKHLQRPPHHRWNQMFNLALQGQPSQFYIARSEEDMKEWLKAFQLAVDMKDEVSRRTGKIVERNTKDSFNADILLYLHVRVLLQGATTREEYMDGIALLQGKILTVPIHWLQQYFEDEKSAISGPYEDVDLDVLEEEVFSINGHLICGGIDSVIGSLKRNIIDLHRCSVCNDDKLLDLPVMKESQAIYHARDIVFNCDRDKSQDNAVYGTNKMLLNEELVTIQQSYDEDEEPVKIQLKSRQCKNTTTRISQIRKQLRGIRGQRRVIGQNSNFENNDDEDHAVEVSIRIPTIHRICNNDLHNLDETFAVMRSTFIQKFIVVSDELKQTGEYVQFEIVSQSI